MAVSHEHGDRLSEPLHRARALLAVGEVQAARDALIEYDEAIEAADLTADPRASEGWPLAIEIHRHAGTPEQGIAVGSRWALTARRRGWLGSLSRVLAGLGNCALDLGDTRRAQRWFEEAEHAAQQADDTLALSVAACGMARMWELRGEDRRCAKDARRAERFARDASDAMALAKALTVAARVGIRSGDVLAASKLEEAERLCVSLGAHTERIRILLDRLPLSFQAGDLDEAAELLERASGEAELIGGHEIRGRVALDRGELLRRQGNIDAACAQYRRALKILLPGTPLVRIAHLNLALAELQMGATSKVAKDIPKLLEVTRGNRFLTGVAHLMGLAAGPLDGDTEDDLWSRHGTPARLALGAAPVDPDLSALAARAATRMLEHADRIEAGRAALVMALQDLRDDPLVDKLFTANCAVPIGPYLALTELGTGGMGQVWLARHADRDRPAAIKVLTPEHQDAAYAIEALETELRAVSTLRHPNIVQLLDHGRVGRSAHLLSNGRVRSDSPYLALEYVPGGTLSPWMGKLSWAGVRRVLDDLLSALAHAHARRVLHLDLKPDNILLVDREDPRTGVKLVDFGLALFRQSSRQVFAGTPRFMAPEQVERGRALGPWTDLYALGCLAWGLTAGRAPFEHRDPMVVAQAHLSTPLPRYRPTVEVPEGFEAWLRSLLEKEPTKRPDRARIAARSLAQLDRASPPLAFVPQRRTLVPDAGLALVQELDPELVGRQAERQQLWSAFSDAANGPVLFELSGPLGSGRRAMMDWLATHTHQDGLAEVQVYDAPSCDPDTACSQLLAQLSRRRRNRTGLILLHIHDRSNMLLADNLRRRARVPLLIVARCYPRALGRPDHRLNLKPLDDALIREVLAGVLPTSPTLERRLVRWAHGNPGLAVATLRALAASGELRPSLDGWDVQHGALQVPDAIRRALEPHLTATNAEEEEALELAAAMGRTFGAELWAELSEAAMKTARRLERAALLRHDGKRRFAERTYTWMQPAALHLIAQRPSTRLAHARIAEALRSRGADAADIGRHFLAARRYADAHRPLLDAVKAAMDAGDNDSARRYLSNWEEALERLAVGRNDPRRLAGRRLKARLA